MIRDMKGADCSGRSTTGKHKQGEEGDINLD